MSPVQIDLFGNEVLRRRRAAKPIPLEKQIEAAKMRLDAAEDGLLLSVDNEEYIATHLRASRKGDIDANWIDGAMRFGLFHEGWWAVVRGSYDRKTIKVLRRVYRNCHSESHGLRQAMYTARAELRKLEAFSCQTRTEAED